MDKRELYQHAFDLLERAEEELLHVAAKHEVEVARRAAHLNCDHKQRISESTGMRHTIHEVCADCKETVLTDLDKQRCGSRIMNIVEQCFKARRTINDDGSEAESVDIGIFTEGGECVAVYTVTPTEALTFAAQLIEAAKDVVTF